MSKQNKEKKLKLATIIALCVLLVSGCGRSSENTSVILDKEVDLTSGVIDYETSTLGIDSNSKTFEEQLTNNSYYVVHEGIYYPLYTYFKNDEANDKISSAINDERMVFYTLDNYQNIPTLFPGDHLVYYSQDTMFDYVTWERYRPLGVTFGIYDLQQTTGGRYYLSLERNDTEVILPDCALYPLYDLGIDNVTIDKVGGVVVDNDVVMDGIIVGATEGTAYDVEVYTGTYYKHYNVKADTYAFKAYELFASAGSETLQDCFWEVNIPEYFVNGYYDVNGTGIVRILKETGYSGETDFDKQLLFPNPNTYDPSKYEDVRIYSEVEALNSFSQKSYPEELGYVDPNAEEAAQEEPEVILPEAAKFKEANIKEYELWFPEGRQCTIEIKSKSGETTGSAVISFDTGGVTSVSYNRFDDVYSAVINGKGNTGILSVSGFWFDYDITLTNVEIYNGQDMETDAIDSTSTDVSDESAQKPDDSDETDGEE